MKVDFANYCKIKSDFKVIRNPIKETGFGARKKLDLQLYQNQIQGEIRKETHEDKLRHKELEERIKQQQLKEDDFIRYFFNFREGRVGKDECIDIIKNHPATLMEAYKRVDNLQNISGDNLEESPKITAKAAFNLKEYFDKKYDNYRIVSIGTSPAPISQAMEYLGCEVQFIPLSGMRHLDATLIKKIMENKNIDGESTLRNLKIILNYFKSKIPENDIKTNIILDYSCSGKTINGAVELLSKYSGLNKDNFVAAPLDDTLLSASKNISNAKFKKFKLNKTDMEKIHSDCFNQRIERISCTPHFDVNDTVNRMRIRQGEDAFYIKSEDKAEDVVFEKFEKFNHTYADVYSLCTFNELYKMGLVEI